MNSRHLLSKLAVAGVAVLLLILTIISSSTHLNAGNGNNRNDRPGSLLGQRGQSLQQRVAKKIAGTWFGNDGLAVQGYLQLDASGNVLLSTTGELGAAILQVPNPMAGEEGQPDTLPLSLQGTHTAAYGTWWATGRNTFEMYFSSMYHRPAEYDAPPLSPAPFTGVWRFWTRGEVIDGVLHVEVKSSLDPCDETGCPDPSGNTFSFEEAPFPQGRTWTLNPMHAPQG